MRLILVSLLIFSYSISYAEQEPKDTLLFNAFKQGEVDGGGNCSSIALIKAAIGTFGIGNVFNYSNVPGDNMIVVKLRNDSMLSVKYVDISDPIKNNGFKMKAEGQEAKRIKEYADTCFTVLVKMNQIMRNQTTYKRSLDTLLK